MKVVVTREELRAARAEMGLLGLVPTMGYLHDGHLSLVRRAKAECDRAAASIFVNPTQFGPGEDLASYPRDLDRDLDLLERVGCHLVWTPRVEDVYPPGFATSVDVGAGAGGLTEVLEGAHRPGHFRGVATVVTILLNAVRPDRAYFGQKDAQQALVIRRLAADLALPGEIVIAPTVREPDGLAMSSRNAYLEPDQRTAATALVRALRAAEAAWSSGVRDARELRLAMDRVLRAEPLAQVEYASVADASTLVEILGDVDPARGALASLAVRIGRTRLIDNTLLGAADG